MLYIKLCTKIIVNLLIITIRAVLFAPLIFTVILDNIMIQLAKKVNKL